MSQRPLHLLLYPFPPGCQVLFCAGNGRGRTPPLHTGFRRSFRRGRCPRSEASTLGVHRPAVSPPHPLRCSVGADDPVRPLYPVIPSQCSHWRGNPYPAPAGAESPASLCEAAQCSHWVVRSEAKLRCQRAALTEGLSKGIFRAPARGTFALGGKSTQKRRSNLRFENPFARLHPPRILTAFATRTLCPANFT